MSLAAKQLYLALAITGGLMLGTAAAEETPTAQGAKPVAQQDPAMLPLIAEKGYRCSECHRVDSRLVGPAFKEVAAKRKDHPWARTLLASKIWNGGTGEYGSSEMPHMDEVSNEDVYKIVDWILSLQ